MTKKSKVLITGGCGFVGRHFTHRLINDGHNVTVVDDLSTGIRPEDWPTNLQVNSELKFHQMDVRDFFKESTEPFDLVFHFAAVVGGRQKIENDPLQVATDLAIDSSLFNWLIKIKSGLKKVLYFSSSAVYPIAKQSEKINELLSEELVSFNDYIGKPDMTYGWAKLSGEYLAKFAFENYGIKSAIYRPFSGYGEDQSFDYPFPSIVNRAMETDPPMIVWGTGEQKRDFIHINDIVNIVMDTKDVLKPGEVLNLGTGIGVSFYRLAQKCLEIVGRDMEIICDTSKPAGVFHRVANIERMLKYSTPKISLEEGIERTVKFLSSQKSD